MVSPPSSQRIPGFVFLLCLLFFGISYLGGLDIIPLRYDNDEGRRAIVTAEMMISGDYLTPTINGEIYLNKPPLYNWIVSVYFRVFGDYSMFAFRLQVIVAILATGCVIYYFTKKYCSQVVAFFTAFAFMTNGRILIYDSFLGLIDTTFTLTVYLSFMLIFMLGEKKKYYALFLVTYFLAALGFLMKGMPALVFQGLTLLTYFTWRKKLRILFHPSHFLGIGLMLAILCAYYIPYLSRNELDPLVVFGNLLNESSKRTAGYFDLGRTLLHFFSFPLEMLYHFAPWTLFVVALFQRKPGKLIRQHDFIFYCTLVFLVNFPVYWISPEVYARYLFMFVPLIYVVLFYLYFETLSESSWQHKLVNGVAVGACILLLVTFIVLPFTRYSTPLLFYPIVLILLMGILTIYVIRYKPIRLIVFLLAIFVLRIGFNWFVLPPRIPLYQEAKERGQKIYEITKGKPLFLLHGSNVGNFDGMSFHISTLRGDLLKWGGPGDSSAFFIADKKQLAGKNYQAYLSFPGFYAPDTLQLVRFR